MVDAMPPVRGKAGRPRRRPLVLYAGRAYGSKRHHQRMRRRGIEPKFARRRTKHGSVRGHRWASERTTSWLHGLGRLRVRKDRKATYNERWLIDRHGHRSPSQVRRDLVSRQPAAA